MTTFGDDLIQALNEALAHANGHCPGIVNAPVTPRDIRKQANLTQAQIPPLMANEPFRLPEVGARDPARQRHFGHPISRDRERTGRDETGTAGSVTDVTP